MIKIKVCEEFTDTPGARYKSDGKYSGEEFRDEILVPKYNEAKEKGEKLLIDLDGGYGYATSFLEESFGGLARKYSKKEIKEVLEVKSEDEPELEHDIYCYIDNARER